MRKLFIGYLILFGCAIFAVNSSCSGPKADEQAKEKQVTPSDSGAEASPDKVVDNGSTDKGSTDPDKGSTDPDKGSTNPDKGSTNPDKGSTNPDKGSTNPDKGSTNPDKGSTNPDKGSNPDKGTPGKGICTIKSGGKSIFIQADILLPDSILKNGQVLVDASGKITCVGTNCKAKASGATQITCTKGVLSPGLINPHDHITWALGKPHSKSSTRYDHRHEWRKGKNGKPKVSAPGGNRKREAVSVGEIRMLMSGVTSIVGSGSAPGFLRNLDVTSAREGLPGKLRYSTFPLGDSGGSLQKTGCANYKIDKESTVKTYDAYFPHIAEGIGESARNEFRCTSTNQNGGQDLVRPNSAFIHSIGLNPSDIFMMATDQTSLVWSPRSNIDLYGHTALVTIFMRKGVNIALGTDWIISGSMNMARELQCADYLNKNHFNNTLKDKDLFKMATINGAIASKTSTMIGSIKVGLFADLTIFDGSKNSGYRAVINAKPQDILLVMRQGKPLYGNASIIEKVVSNGSSDCETIDVCGASKRICFKNEKVSSTVSSYAALIKAFPPTYPMFFCGTPTNEPSCLPVRPGEFGQSKADDQDGDGIKNAKDNCPKIFNPIRPIDNKKQGDVDGDGIGDVCDKCPLSKDNTKCKVFDPNDRDGDGIPNAKDNCPSKSNPKQADQDKDKIGDLCDKCPTKPNPNGAACPATSATIYDVKTKKVGSGTSIKLDKVLVTGFTAKRDRFFLQLKKGDSTYKGAPNSGVMVYLGGKGSLIAKVKLGNRVSFQAVIGDFKGELQLTNLSNLVVHSGVESLPAPVIIKPADMKKASASAKALKEVIVQVENVEVTNANPDSPKDYGEFEIAASADKANKMRVDDILDSTSYIGSRYCRWTPPAKGDDSVCMPGRTCQCPKAPCDKKTGGLCYKTGGKPLVDKRKVGDKFKKISGILVFSYGNYKILPRNDKDLQK